MKLLSLFFLLLIFASDAAILNKNNVTNTKVKQAKIYGLTIKDKKINLLLLSNGCTNKHSFTLQWHNGQLTIFRTKADNCRRMPHKIWLTFALPENTTHFNLSNKLYL
jgi:hypothetical protein